jgi:hypothetical protein
MGWGAGSRSSTSRGCAAGNQKKIEPDQVAADDDWCEALVDGADFSRAIAAQSIYPPISAFVLIE